MSRGLIPWKHRSHNTTVGCEEEVSAKLVFVCSFRERCEESVVLDLMVRCVLLSVEKMAELEEQCVVVLLQTRGVWVCFLECRRTFESAVSE